VENAGYLDVSNFTRKFKLAEGITPGQYRKAMQENGQPEDTESGSESRLSE